MHTNTNIYTYQSPEEKQILEGIPYSNNEIYLHRDPALMPAKRKVWASVRKSCLIPCIISPWIAFILG